MLKNFEIGRNKRRRKVWSLSLSLIDCVYVVGGGSVFDLEQQQQANNNQKFLLFNEKKNGGHGRKIWKINMGLFFFWDRIIDFLKNIFIFYKQKDISDKNDMIQ